MQAQTIVLKFGGSSVGSPERILRTAQIINQYRGQYFQLVVVVSAMGDTTDELIELAKKVSPRALGQIHRREMDMLLSTGERISMALLSMALGDLGVNALSLTGSQSGIITSASFGEACIQQIKPIRIYESLEKQAVVIVAGFQGVSEVKEITTLGRGGSDTSAVALATVLGAKECVIYTDVDGFFSADPRKVTSAQRLALIPWQLAIESAARGAQVLHPRCVELAWKHKMPIRVRSSMNDSSGSINHEGLGSKVEGTVNLNLESIKIFSVTLQRELHRITLNGFEDPLTLGLFFEKMSIQGFRSLSWNYEKPRLNVLLETTQRHFIESTKIFAEKKGLYRLSLVGTGFVHQPDCIRMLNEMARLSHCEIINSNVSATSLDLEFETPAEANAERFLSTVHDQFIES